MTVKTGSAWAGTFVTLDATGALASSTDAAGTLYVDGTANAATVTITGSNPYKWAVTLPSLTAGQRVDMYITATIATIATAGFVASAQADTTLLSDGVAVASIANGAITAGAIATGAITNAKFAAGAIDAAAIADNAIDAGAIAADAIDADALKTDAITKIQTGLATPTNITAGTITTVTNLTNLPAVSTDWLTAAGIKADAVTKIQLGLALEATLTAIKGAGWTNETLAALKAYVDEIETRLTAARAGYLDKLNVTGTLANSDAAATYKADVSALALAADLQDVEDKIDVIATDTTTEIPATLATLATAAALAAAQADLDNPDQYKANVSGLMTAAAYTAPDNASIGAIKTKTDQLVFTTPNKVDATATVDPTGIATSAALAIVDANVDAIKLKTDALDVSSVTVVAAVSGSTITILRGDTFSADLSDLGSLAAYVSLDFTVKANSYQTDDDAAIRIRKNASALSDGLVRLNGAAHTTGTDGLITITDAAAGDVTIMLKAGVTDELVPGTYVYDIQLIEADEVSTLTTGTLIVSADVTRLVA